MYKNTWVLEGLLKGEEIVFSSVNNSLDFLNIYLEVIIYFDRSVSKGYHFNVADSPNEVNELLVSTFSVKSKGRFAVIILQSPFDFHFENIKIKTRKTKDLPILIR